MSMYVLQVRTGQEERLVERLRRRGVEARCPQERRMVRRGGKWQSRLYTIFPGYLFLSCEDPVRIYHIVSRQSGVLRWLGMQGGSPTPLMPGEETRILCMAGDGAPLPPSEAVQMPDGQLAFVAGPLAELQGSIQKIDRHDRRATVRIPLHGEERMIKLSFTIVTQDTAQSVGAGSPPGRMAEDRG